LFYRAQVYEVRGASQTSALHRAFSTPAAHSIAAADPVVADPHWQAYAARFFRRRWLVPAIAAAIYPITKDRSLLDVAMLGYVLCGVAVYALLRLRFKTWISLAAAAATLLLPPVRQWGGFPLTDTWGAALECLAFLMAVLALERGGRWIGALAVVMLALSFTRDATIVLLLGIGWIALTARTRRSVAVLGTGVLASLPVPLLFGVPLVQELSWELSDFRIPAHTSWSFVLSRYPHQLWSVLHQDIVYPGGQSAHLLVYAGVLLLLVCVAWMVIAAPRQDHFFTLIRVAIIGCVITVALGASFTNMRLELVFLPVVAVALAFPLQNGRSVARAVQEIRGRIRAPRKRASAVLRQDAARLEAAP
jgi:hypothetical protein